MVAQTQKLTNMKEYKVTVNNEGTTHWYNEDGQLHREGGPAIEWADGAKEWCLNGQLHREDGPAREGADGYKEWYLNGQLHREDGPAIEGADGYKEWYFNGVRHREDGPAIEYVGGYKSWWLNGQRLTEEEFNKRTQPHKEMTVTEISKLLGYEVKIVKG
jgi:hypothetical protein